MAGELQLSLFDWRPNSPRDLATDGASKRTENDPAADRSTPQTAGLRGADVAPRLTTAQSSQTLQYEQLRGGARGCDPAGSTPQGWTRAVSALEGRPAGSPLRGRPDQDGQIQGAADGSVPRAARDQENASDDFELRADPRSALRAQTPAERSAANSSGDRTRPSADRRADEQRDQPAARWPQPSGPRLVAATEQAGSSCITLRPYQHDAIAAVEREWQRGNRRTLAVLPTGTGKTVCFSELARRCVARGKRALVVAHRSELLEQAQRKLAELGVRAAIEQAQRRAGRAPVVVGSVQSLRGDRLAALRPDEFGLLVIDEGHHATAASYRAILEQFAGIDTVLVTATADRADGVALGKVCDSVAYRLEMREAIRDGWLVPIRAKRIHVADLDLSHVRSHHGDLDQRELAAIMQREQALHGVVAPLLELARDRRTIAFAVDVAHARAIADVANRYRSGVACAVDGSASDDERAAVLAAFRRGDFQILVNCALYTEGFDEPSISCVALCRPTQSRALHTQMVGRGTRLLGDTLERSISNGKRDVLVLDFVGNAGKHKLVGPIDALAGIDLPDDVREAAERELEAGQVELEEVLAHAEREVEKRREHVRLIALTHYRTTEIDPFFAELSPEPDGAWARQPATPAQLKALVTAGFSRLPSDLTRGEASRYLDGLQERRKRGLVGLKAARRLHSLGLDVKNMTAHRAGQLFGKLRKRGWGKSTVMHEPEFRRNGK